MDIRDRIRKLRAMTTEAGCTEAETYAAAEKAAALMREAGLSEAQIEADQCGSRSRSGARTARGLVWAKIAQCTNTAAVVTRVRNGTHVEFVGYGGGPAVADYLRVVCDRAIDGEIRRFRDSKIYQRRRSPKTRRQASADFTGELCNRIIIKLHWLFVDQMDSEVAAGALALRDDLHPDSRSIKRGKRPTRFHDARLAGYMAGERVQLSHGVNGQSERPQIGSAS